MENIETIKDELINEECLKLEEVDIDLINKNISSFEREDKIKYPKDEMQKLQEYLKFYK